MACQDLPATADLAHDCRIDVLDLLKVVFIAVAPPVILLLGAVVAVDAARELNNTIAKIKEPIDKIDKAVIAEFKERLQRFLWIWPLIPALQLCVAAFAHVVPVRSEGAEGVAVLAYIAGFVASLVAYTLYEPYFALFTEFWRRLTEFTYLGSVVLIYYNAFIRLVYK